MVQKSDVFSLSDPSVERYRVQWVPEYCRHNQTRPMEKVITQVTQVHPKQKTNTVKQHEATQLDCVSKLEADLHLIFFIVSVGPGELH